MKKQYEKPEIDVTYLNANCIFTESASLNYDDDEAESGETIIP